MTDTIDKIRESLTEALSPVKLVLKDESHKHAGHAGNKDGGGHYVLSIVSAAFEGKSLIQRHRLVYEILGDMMKQEIHALSIDAKTPSEA